MSSPTPQHWRLFHLELEDISDEELQDDKESEDAMDTPPAHRLLPCHFGQFESISSSEDFSPPAFITPSCSPPSYKAPPSSSSSISSTTMTATPDSHSQKKMDMERYNTLMIRILQWDKEAIRAGLPCYPRPPRPPSVTPSPSPPTSPTLLPYTSIKKEPSSSPEPIASIINGSPDYNPPDMHWLHCLKKSLGHYSNIRDIFDDSSDE